MDKSTETLKQKAFHEVKESFIIAFYLWAILGLLILHKSMILSEEQIDFAHHGLALINALALAKVMLVAKRFDLSARMRTAPLIVPTLLNSAFFTVALACFKLLEDAVIGHFRHQSFQQSISDFAGGTWQGVLTLSSLFFVLLIPFVGFGELGRVLGEDKLASIFFHGHRRSSR